MQPLISSQSQRWAIHRTASKPSPCPLRTPHHQREAGGELLSCQSRAELSISSLANPGDASRRGQDDQMTDNPDVEGHGMQTQPP